MFWNQYRRTMPYIQAIVIAIAFLMWFNGHFSPLQIIVIVLAMELGGVLGAVWAVRIKRRAASAPLSLR